MKTVEEYDLLFKLAFGMIALLGFLSITHVYLGH